MEKDNRIAFFLIPAASAAALGLALVAQYGFGLHPCELCQYQRVPYLLAILVGSIFYCHPGFRPGSTEKHITYFKVDAVMRRHDNIYIIYFLLMAAETALAFYHFAVEKGYVSSGCSDKIGGEGNAQEMLDKIMAAPVVSCSQPQFEFLHISMAGYNGIYALCLAIIAIILWKKNAAR